MKIRTLYDNEDWFDKFKPISIIPFLKPQIANEFRRKNIRGFVNIGGCNFYIGLTHCDYLIGVLGFSNPEMGKYDILLKADTTPSLYENSTDLLLYVLRTKDVQKALEYKFNRKINTAYSMCFSQHNQINRYRKHAELITKKQIRINKFSADERLKQIANAAVRKMKKEPCEVCGKTDYVEAHHKDYNFPEKVNWLCVEHHNERDGIDGTCYKIIGYNLGYLFKLGTIDSLRAAKALFIQKHKI